MFHHAQIPPPPTPLDMALNTAKSDKRQEGRKAGR